MTFDALYYIADKREYRYFTEYRCIPRIHKLHPATTPFFASPSVYLLPTLLSINVNPIKRKYEWESLIKIDSHTYTTRTYTSARTRLTRQTSRLPLALYPAQNEDVSEEHFPFALIASHSSRLSSRKTAGTSSRSRRVFP